MFHNLYHLNTNLTLLIFKYQTLFYTNLRLLTYEIKLKMNIKSFQNLQNFTFLLLKNLKCFELLDYLYIFLL